MDYKVKTARSFEKELKRLGKRYVSIVDDYANLLAITSKGRGKSGGARVITFTVVVAVEETEINLLYVYDKAERASISRKEIEELLRKNGLKG